MNDTSRTTSQMARKLRSSCDACGEAKTKCDRGQPHCTRCISLNVTCVYGPSRQSGKRPRRRLDAGRNPLTSGRATSIGPSNGTSTSNLPIQPSHSGPYEQDPLPSVTLADMEEMMIPQAFTPNIPNIANNHTTNHHFGDPGFFLPSLPSSWPEFEHHSSNEYMLTTPFFTDPQPQESTLPSPPPTTTTADTSGHRCYHEPNQILDSLTIFHTPGIANQKTTLELSQILHTNRSAIEGITRFLKCDCSKTRPDLVTLQASLVARVLYFYKQAAGYAARDFSRSEPSSAEGAPTSTTSTTSTTTSTSPSSPTPALGAPQIIKCPEGYSNSCFIVVEMPFKVGTFNVDTPAVQFAFRNHLIGTEVKKVEPVIEGFVALSQREGVEEGYKGLYDCVGDWLRREFEGTMGVFRGNVRRATERMEL
ncbi:hypothetical protein CC80DRAFT_538183 [Byssothecium circinans]|uniref:Zn(2)-C6 fungal-type domain-containing protein n=1 Tax=Byssothecium circinans TaxID=147558 RepID=A0A6A5TUB2_9PLEO|nr:hypothetical protein CC80DRAFT_538183 [Byssothecium circinans]